MPGAALMNANTRRFITGTDREREFLSLTLAGDVATKASATRRSFHRRLRSNLKDLLRRTGYDEAWVDDSRDRIDIHGVDAKALAPLSRVFGVQAVRRVRSLPWQDIDDIVTAGTRLYADTVAGRRFAVRPRRVGQRRQIPLRLGAVAEALGDRLVAAGGRVDLDHPEVAVHIEVRASDVLFFDVAVPGPGGLPVGVEGRALALISGGFDSAVAAWQMLRRGVELDFLLFNLAGWPQERATRDVLHALEQRWLHGGRPHLYIVDFRPLVAEMRSHVRGRYWQVLLKRLMMRAADEVARTSGAQALVTGEAIGQVSSQTLTNLAAITARTETPILRPLVGHNKQEIVELARQIGTADASAGVEEFCALEGGPPATRASAADLDRGEERLGLERVRELARHHRVVPRDAFGDALADSPEIDHVPDHAAVVDLRTEAEYRQWSWPAAIHLEFDKALEFAGRLPRDRAYLCYCEVGLKSAYLAEMMRRLGHEAYSFRGGVGPLQRHARQHDANARQHA